MIASRQAQRLAAFQESLPSSYRTFYLDRFPNSQIASKLFAEWHSMEEEHEQSPFTQYERPGLIFFGPPRTGKTRLACELVRRLIGAERSAADARFISAVQWSAEASTRAKACELDGWAHSIVKFAWRLDCDPGVLIIDDIDKVRGTPVIQSELFNLIETVTANEMTLIVTTNISSSELANKFDSEFGEAIVSRLKEFCVPVGFGK